MLLKLTKENLENLKENIISNVMVNKLIIFFLPFLFFSCENLQLNKEKRADDFVASVGESKLYKSDIENILPRNITKQDSVVLVKSFMTSWAKQQLLLQKALENVSEVNSNEIDLLVKKYKESLYINGYKERLI